MKYKIINDSFPLVVIQLDAKEKAHIQQGSMIYRSPSVTLNTKLNAEGSGIGKFVKAVGRSMASGESIFVTEATSSENGGQLAIAPAIPGQVIALELGNKQYRLNDGAFLALDGSAHYKMTKQTLGRAIFGGQGGLYVMTTGGNGTLLANAFGSIHRIDLQNDEVTIDNSHVVAWSADLNYDIHFDNGWLQSIGTGEGLVNTFKGTGEIYVQSLNLQTFSDQLGINQTSNNNGSMLGTVVDLL